MIEYSSASIPNTDSNCSNFWLDHGRLANSFKFSTTTVLMSSGVLIAKDLFSLVLTRSMAKRDLDRPEWKCTLDVQQHGKPCSFLYATVFSSLFCITIYVCFIKLKRHLNLFPKVM